MESEKLSPLVDLIKVRENLVIDVPDNAIGIRYVPEDLEIGRLSCEEDKEIEYLQFVFEGEKL